jgi:hypothetical protein
MRVIWLMPLIMAIPPIASSAAFVIRPVLSNSAQSQRKI